MKVINSFTGDFAFLSNFFKDASFIDDNGIKWKTSEHFYQAMKTMDLVERRKIEESITPGIAKRLGSKVDLRTDWDDIKYDVMINALGMKFDQNEKYRNLLIQTDGYKLVEGNNWHDNEWGDCFCDKCKNIKGKNMLGKLLMELRDYYIEEKEE